MNQLNFNATVQVPPEESALIRAALLKDCVNGTADVLDFINRITQ